MSRRAPRPLNEPLSGLLESGGLPQIVFRGGDSRGGGGGDGSDPNSSGVLALARWILRILALSTECFDHFARVSPGILIKGWGMALSSDFALTVGVQGLESLVLSSVLCRARRVIASCFTHIFFA